MKIDQNVKHLLSAAPTHWETGSQKERLTEQVRSGTAQNDYYRAGNGTTMVPLQKTTHVTRHLLPGV